MKLSIVTPNYNYEQFIGQTIESVVAQDYDNIEYIIVDDGSTDNSIELIKSYQKLYPKKIKLIQQENKGQTCAINTALKNTTGDIIGWINSDDTYLPGTFRKIVKEFKENNVDIVFGDVNIMDLKGNFIYRLRHFRFCYVESVFVGFSNTLTSNSVFWRKSLTNSIDLMKENLKCNMDGEYFSRLTLNKKVIYIKEPLANFRRQEKTKAAEKTKEWEIFIAKERNETQRLAYYNLSMSKYISYDRTKLFGYCFLLFRSLKRVLFFHYQRKFIEKLVYKLKLRK